MNNRKPRAAAVTLTTMAVLLLLSGCGPLWDPGVDPTASSRWHRLTAEEMPIAFPPTSKLLVLGGRTRSTGLRSSVYEVTLDNPTWLPRENRVVIEVRNRPTSAWDMLASGNEAVFSTGFTDSKLSAHLVSEFPGMEAGIADTLRRNAYGEYGWAKASTGEDATCVFAWQVIDDSQRILPRSIVALRITYRYCGTGTDPSPWLGAFDRIVLTLDGVLPGSETDALDLAGTEASGLSPSAAHARHRAERSRLAASSAAVPARMGTPRRDDVTGYARDAGQPLSGAALDPSRPNDARLIQAALAQRDLYQGPIDGIWGRQTREALAMFRHSMGLDPAGVLKPEVERMLLNP